MFNDLESSTYLYELTTVDGHVNSIEHRVDDLNAT